MKSLLTITVLGLFCHSLALGQDFSAPQKKESNAIDPTSFESINDAFFGASVGPSFPLGQFKNDDFQNPVSGYAEPGFHLNLVNAQQKFGRHFGLGVNWYRGQYGFNTDAFVEPYQQLFQGLTFDATTEEDWILNSVTGNLIINIPHKYFDVDVRVGAGACRVSRPQIIMEGYENATGFLAFSWIQERNIKTDLILGFGMNGRIHVTPALDILLQWDYQRMTTTLDITNIYALSFSEQEELEQQFEILNLGLGVGIQID